MPALDCYLLTFDSENVTYMHLPFDDIRYSPDASCNVNYFLFSEADEAEMNMNLYEINKNNRVYATHGPSPIKKMFRDRTEVMLDWRGPGPGPGPVRSLVMYSDFWNTSLAIFFSC